MTKKAISGGPPELRQLASAYRKAQKRHGHRGIYRFPYHVLLPLFNEPALTKRDIADKLKLAPEHRKDISTVSIQFFPFTARARRRMKDAERLRKKEERRLPTTRAPVFPLFSRYLALVGLDHLFTPISVHPTVCDIGGVRCGPVYTTRVRLIRGLPYAYWPIPDVEALEFVSFIADIEDEHTPFKGCICVPRGKVPKQRYFFVRLGERKRQKPTFDIEPYLGERGLLLLRNAVEKKRQQSSP